MALAIRRSRSLASLPDVRSPLSSPVPYNWSREARWVKDAGLDSSGGHVVNIDARTRDFLRVLGESN